MRFRDLFARFWLIFSGKNAKNSDEVLEFANLRGAGRGVCRSGPEAGKGGLDIVIPMQGSAG